jgi:hypothetical protein
MNPKMAPASPTRARNLAFPGTILWVKDAGRVVVVDERQGRTYSLEGLEAAVWSWISLARPFTEVVDFIAESKGLAPGEAEQVLGGILERWLAAGLVEERMPDYG